MDTGSQKTHNVCASAPVHEVCLRRASLAMCCQCSGPWEVLGWCEVRQNQKKGSLVNRKME